MKAWYNLYCMFEAKGQSNYLDEVFSFRQRTTAFRISLRYFIFC